MRAEFASNFGRLVAGLRGRKRIHFIDVVDGACRGAVTDSAIFSSRTRNRCFTQQGCDGRNHMGRGDGGETCLVISTS